MLYLLIPRVREHNIEGVKKMKRKGNIREVEKIEKMRKIKKTLGK